MGDEGGKQQIIAKAMEECGRGMESSLRCVKIRLFKID
jgi:hypothetical protein